MSIANLLIVCFAFRFDLIRSQGKHILVNCVKGKFGITEAANRDSPRPNSLARRPDTGRVSEMGRWLAAPQRLAALRNSENHASPLRTRESWPRISSGRRRRALVQLGLPAEPGGANNASPSRMRSCGPPRLTLWNNSQPMPE